MNALGAAVGRALTELAAARDVAPGVLVAVSGGPDSLALLLAAASLAPERPVFATTVDHALRPEGADEARIVARYAAEIGIPHATLVWHRSRPLRNLQGEARDARYRLLSAHARRVGAGAVLTAHHRRDQIETHLLLGARGAGGAALAAMRTWRDLEPHVALVRPFLSCDPADLADAVSRAGWLAVDDPSNHDPRFARVRLRRSLERVDEVVAIRGIRQAEALRRDEDAHLATELRELWEGVGPPVRTDRRAEAPGALVLPGGIDHLSTRFLSRAVTAAGGGAAPPSAAAMIRLRERLCAERRATLGNCLVSRGPDGLVLSRESGRSFCPVAVAGEDGTAWFDRRFLVVGLGPGVEVRGPGGAIPAAEARRRERYGRPMFHVAGRAPVEVPISPERLPATRSSRLEAFETVSWRLWADLPGPVPEPLTARLQIAAKRGSPVGKV